MASRREKNYKLYTLCRDTFGKKLHQQSALKEINR